MAIENIQINVVARPNLNRKSAGYQKYYYKVNSEKTMTTRGFLHHIKEHGLSVPDSLMQASFTQIAACLRELVLTGIPVKLDGLGTITPYVSSKGEEITDIATAKYFASAAGMRSALNGLHFRLIPDGTEWDNTQSTKNVQKASFNFEGMVITDLQGGTAGTVGNKKKAIISVSDYKELINPEP